MRGMRFDPRIHYWSASRKEVILLSDMNEVHIINALLKECRAWERAVKDCQLLDEAIELLKNPPSSTINYQSMLFELERREENASTTDADDQHG